MPLLRSDSTKGVGMTKATEAFREWLGNTERTRDGEPHPFTDQERNLLATAFISGWHQGHTDKEGKP